MLTGIAGKVGQIHLGTQIVRGKGLRPLVAAPCVGQKAVAIQQSTNIEQGRYVSVRGIQHAPADRQHLIKAPALGKALRIHQHHQFNCPKLIVPLLLRNSRSSSPLALVGSLLAACALALALAWSCAWASWPSVCKCCMDSN